MIYRILNADTLLIECKTAGSSFSIDIVVESENHFFPTSAFDFYAGNGTLFFHVFDLGRCVASFGRFYGSIAAQNVWVNVELIDDILALDHPRR